MSRKVSLLALCLGAALSTSAIASPFNVMDNPAKADKNFTGDIQLGYNASNGNSKNSTILGSTAMTWFKSDFAYSFIGKAENSTSSDERSAEKYEVGLRARYNINNDLYTFAQAGWLNDRFAGYDSRSTFVTGLGYQALQTAKHNLFLEAGPGVRHDEYHGAPNSDGDWNVTEVMGYGAANYSYQISDNAKFTQTVSVEGAKSSVNVVSDTGLNVAISDRFGLRLSYNVNHNTKAPVGKVKTDTKWAATLTYAL